MWAWLKSALGIPTEAERVAKREFRLAHPGVTVGWTMLAATERERFVVGVAYDWGGKPLRYRFYAVAPNLGSVAEIADDQPYQPKGLR